ncbi:uncharacterized protein F5Z01DRAFT_655719 [Emericellopsis atlantica]|uniref:Rhodopsin domain-containing protein n=1 Tax=Emericellopsis atlantica TaxID=2614577 RepID=A0A9P8CPD4_9HYPO|nr:uncharacterized protein F5Z01DRAFT_655719 [Emericellopsis atlantica]KAG9254010.1 hypothetical protein F5Z01DRAFT_655719 [Emericellopsis atlantica]
MEIDFDDSPRFLDFILALFSRFRTKMSASGDWGPTPKGMDLTENQTMSILVTVITIMALGILSVILRLVARLKSGNSLAVDDYTIVLALIFAIGTAVLCFTSIQEGGGKHLWIITFEEFTRLWQMAYAFVLIYATCVTLTKASILLFYRRLFGINLAWKINMALVLGYWVAIIIAWLSGCRPASYFWEQFTKPDAQGSCIDTSLFYFVNGICAMLIDILILLVPIPTIIKLRMRRSQKVAVSGILLLGAFVCIASILRIVSMDHLVNAEDFTWAMGQVFIWSCCEPFIGIVCACLPTYGPLFRKWWQTINTSVGSGEQNSGSGSRGIDLENTHVRNNLERREFRRLHSSNLNLRDDEFELTNEISGGKKSVLRGEVSDEDIAYGARDITVVKDTWVTNSKAT